MKHFQIQAAGGPTITTPVPDGPLFSAICKVVGDGSGVARPHVLTYFLEGQDNAERFVRDHQDGARRFTVGDKVTIEFSRLDILETGFTRHMLVMSVNGEVRQEWGTLIEQSGSLVVQWRSRGDDVVLDCVPIDGDAGLSQYGTFLQLPELSVGERVVFCIAATDALTPGAAAAEPDGGAVPTGGFDSLPQESRGRVAKSARREARTQPWWRFW